MVPLKSPWSSSGVESRGKNCSYAHRQLRKACKRTICPKGDFQPKAIPRPYRHRTTSHHFHEGSYTKDVCKNFKLGPPEKNEKHIDSSSNRINFLRAMIGQVESGARKLDKAPALVAENGSRTVIGRERLRGLGIKLKTEGGKCENNLVNKPPNKLSSEFKELFSRHGRLEGQEKKAQLKQNCAPKQQKGDIYHRSSKILSKKINRDGPL